MAMEYCTIVTLEWNSKNVVFVGVKINTIIRKSGLWYGYTLMSCYLKQWNPSCYFSATYPLNGPGIIVVRNKNEQLTQTLPPFYVHNLHGWKFFLLEAFDYIRFP